MNEYEKLKREGYTEHPINPELDMSTNVDLFDAPMATDREDKGVNVTYDGVTKRSSNIMMGYNRDGIVLESGEYVPIDEIVHALNVALESDGENVKVACKRTGRVMSPPEMITEVSDIVKEASMIRLNGENPKIKNQDSQNVEIKSTSKKEFINKGLLMLGNRGLKLPNGEYVQAAEIQKAIQDYVVLKAPKKAAFVPPDRTPQTPKSPSGIAPGTKGETNQKELAKDPVTTPQE